ncbi:hypothetical protein BU15DRAFT_67954 [Melanogaster broomeanus]|nr:hypothetical protein BU15DRAFT_67954 [Melanogaster broomeanus]
MLPLNRNFDGLFRWGFVRVMFATGTHALGMNAPTKASVLYGDLSLSTALMIEFQRLTPSKLPSLGANFHGPGNAPVPVDVVQRLFRLAQSATRCNQPGKRGRLTRLADSQHPGSMRWLVGRKRSRSRMDFIQNRWRKRRNGPGKWMD